MRTVIALLALAALGHAAPALAQIDVAQTNLAQTFVAPGQGYTQTGPNFQVPGQGPKVGDLEVKAFNRIPKAKTAVQLVNDSALARNIRREVMVRLSRLGNEVGFSGGNVMRMDVSYFDLSGGGNAGSSRDTNMPSANALEGPGSNPRPDLEGYRSLIKELGLAGEVIGSNDHQRTTYIWKRGKLIPLPEGVMMIVPSRAMPMVKTPLLSWSTKISMGLEYFRKPGDSRDRSVADFVRDHFGQETVDYLAEPLLSGVYGGDPARMSVGAVLPRFLQMVPAWSCLYQLHDEYGTEPIGHGDPRCVDLRPQNQRKEIQEGLPAF